MFSLLSKNKKEQKKGFLGMNAKEHKKFMTKVMNEATQAQLETLRKAEQLEKQQIQSSKN